MQIKNRAIVLMFSAVTGAAASYRAGAQGPPAAAAAPADLLILNGKVYPGNGAAFEQAVAVRGNRIVAVGASDDLAKLRGPNTEVIDARGGAVMPGFNDPHAHMLSGGLELENVNLDGAQTLDECNRASARSRPLTSIGLDPRTRLGVCAVSGKRDAAAARRRRSDRPAVMRCFDGHSVWVTPKRWRWPASPETPRITH
jgi:predicted amidohydrolase YtcJ